MDAFSYLIVLVSIVLGLGITRLLTGLSALVEARARVRVYGPPLAWAGVLLIHFQTWWAFFGLRYRDGWTFAAFLAILVQPALLYLPSALVLPVAVGPLKQVDLRVLRADPVVFRAVRRPLFRTRRDGATTPHARLPEANATATVGLVGPHIALLSARLG